MTEVALETRGTRAARSTRCKKQHDRVQDLAPPKGLAVFSKRTNTSKSARHEDVYNHKQQL